MPDWSTISRACAAALASSVLLCALASCGETTHTVGHLKAARTIDGPKGNGAGAGATPSAQDGGGSASNSDGGSSVAQGDGGTIVGTPDAGGVLASPFAECSGPAEYALRRQLDLYFMIDSNITLPNAVAWPNLMQGLRRYVIDPRAYGTGLGVDYFRLDCNDAYSKPEVEIGTLPGNAQAIIDSVRSQIPINNSPLLPAMRGAIAYASARAKADAAIKIAVVLITDGISDLNCGSSIANLTQVTRDGAEADPPIPTYIVAVDAMTTSVDVFTRSARFDPLQDMAVAAGTGTVRDIDVLAEPPLPTSNEASPTADALVAIQREAEPCDYAVAAGVTDDGTGVWLTRNDDGAAPARLAQVASAEDCSAGGYYLATERGLRWARLCEATCTDIKEQGALVSWVHGCP